MEPDSARPAHLSSHQRPTFLTILCILTFLSCAGGIFNSVSTYSGANFASTTSQEALEQARERVQEEGGSNAVDELLGSVSDNLTADRLRKGAIGNLVFNLLTLIGAVLMWNLRKVGFYVYVAGVLVAVVTPFLVYEGFMSALSFAGTAFISAIFVVLYALNLKYMR
ncbi:DUF2127 domain-containing protein [Larkinella soli]|uniref:DUF2127 domain-containing protein n=1 Tax=Larkinella soli TaxID=1770527 RepID=UPI000FFB2199|nr:DUF2127 domain-containing protein [Larkinella soli]